MHSSGIGQPGSAERVYAKVWPVLSTTLAAQPPFTDSTGSRVCCCELHTLLDNLVLTQME